MKDPFIVILAVGLGVIGIINGASIHRRYGTPPSFTTGLLFTPPPPLYGGSGFDPGYGSSFPNSPNFGYGRPDDQFQQNRPTTFDPNFSEQVDLFQDGPSFGSGNFGSSQNFQDGPYGFSGDFSARPIHPGGPTSGFGGQSQDSFFPMSPPYSPNYSAGDFYDRERVQGPYWNGQSPNAGYNNFERDRSKDYSHGSQHSHVFGPNRNRNRPIY